ncbi:hypothetical protein AVEN_93437-1 [Araneus ventricosus]|uniref:Uncharacterized protein n=1 Tax=Araneus ventricosus TaxID=182803 RepID=A0A4Y2API3_ARAVE|nr:hypothetical protein AVEN_93437-1 [Araneus ventricosus]
MYLVHVSYVPLNNSPHSTLDQSYSFTHRCPINFKSVSLFPSDTPQPLLESTIFHCSGAEKVDFLSAARFPSSAARWLFRSHSRKIGFLKIAPLNL